MFRSQTLAAYGESLYEAVVSIELTLVLLAAPAATAGAICVDKARGTLDHMLATDLSNAEIVLGKIGARLAPVLGLIACVLPIMALTSLLEESIPRHFSVVLDGDRIRHAWLLAGPGPVGLGPKNARSAHDYVCNNRRMAVQPRALDDCGRRLGYTFSPIFGARRLALARVLEPLLPGVCALFGSRRGGLATYLGFLIVCLVLSSLFLGLATLKIRAVALEQAGRFQGKPVEAGFLDVCQNLSWWPAIPGPSLDGNPILWREWHRSRPSSMVRLVWILYAGLGILWIVVSSQVLVNSRGNQEIIGLMSVFQVLLGLLLLSVNAATSLSEERVRGSLDVLLCTPLSTQSILVGKWWGSYRQATPVLIWSAILAGILVAESSHFISYFLLLGLIMANSAVITSLGALDRNLGEPTGARGSSLCIRIYSIFDRMGLTRYHSGSVAVD